MMFDIIPLSLMKSSEVMKKFFHILSEKIEKDSSHLDLDKLQTISFIVSYGGQELDANSILKTLTIIAKKIQFILFL